MRYCSQWLHLAADVASDAVLTLSMSLPEGAVPAVEAAEVAEAPGVRGRHGEHH